MKTQIKTFVLALVVMFAVVFQARAENGTADSAAMQQVIQSQLDAFAADRDDEAYSYAAPIVKQVFPSVDIFMAMVKGGYKPVYRNSSREFLETGVSSTGRPTVRVRLKAMDGKFYEALYTMEQQPDGSWKIAGCALIAIQGLDV